MEGFHLRARRYIFQPKFKEFPFEIKQKRIKSRADTLVIFQVMELTQNKKQVIFDGEYEKGQDSLSD